MPPSPDRRPADLGRPRPSTARPSTAGRAVVGAALGTALAAALVACTDVPEPRPTPAHTLSAPSTAPAAPDDRPGPGTTGVPDGVELEASGPLEITEDGAVVDGLDVDGCVVVAADDVTIRNTRVRCTDAPRGRAVVMDGRREGLLIEDTEIDGGGRTAIGVDVSDVTLRRVDIHHVNDGVRMGARVTVEDSWIHDMTREGELHPDAIQGISAQDVVIRGNHLDPREAGSGDLGNAAIMLGSETGEKVSRDVVIEGNYLDGGNYAINISSTITAENIVVRDNVFGDGSRYGPILTRSDVAIGDGNVLAATGAPVRPDVRDD